MTIAHELGAFLRDVGIQRVYGLPGEDHMTLLDDLTAAGLAYHIAYNEASAVLMAGTDSVFTRRPGVAVLSLAPGVSNAVNGILNAFLEQQPLLVISGQHPADRVPFIVRQGFPAQRLIEPITKWQATVTADMDIIALAARAIDEAMSGRPGPVYLEIPDAAASSPARTGTDRGSAGRRLRAHWDAERTPGPKASGSGDAAQLALRLAAAQRPVLIVGGRRGRVHSATAARFASAYRIPVLTTTRQKGLVAPSHPFYAGTFLNGRLESRLLRRSDLVVMVDPEAFDFYNRPWSFDAETIALVAPDFAEWTNPLVQVQVADPDAVLAWLADDVPDAPSQWQPEEVRAYLDDVRASLLAGPNDGLSVARAIDAALQEWPESGCLVADAGFGKPLVAMLSAPAISDHFLASNALSTMGFAIPTALAASRAGAGPVLAFLGDGSMLMRATELAAAGAAAPLVVVVLLDRCLTQIAVKQERRQLATVGTDLPAISCAQLGPALGVDGVDVETADALRSAVAAGLSSGRPLLVGAVIDPAPSRPVFDLMRG